ncbi:MAG: hypothetical protein J7L47_01940 [Candidatus Odinarchaeota archaeon]|nr:hypothetical protein [Candidatus Odinarchaeota archaeon]
MGKITITENAHLLLKGSGRYTLEVRDTNGTVLFSRKGNFNKTGYAEIVFRISSEKFKVGETYNIRINATDSPFPLFHRYAEAYAYVKFTVERDYPTIALGEMSSK